MSHDATQAEVQAIAQVLTKDRSRNVVRSLAERFKVAESFVEMIAESVVSQKFNFEDASGSNLSPPAPTDRQLRRAEELRDAVNRAEAKEPSQWMHQDMEALAAARFG